MEKALFVLLLNFEFFKANQHRILDRYFPDELQELLKTLISAHEKFQKDLSVEELKALHFVSHPALSKSAKDNFEFIFKILSAETPADPKIANEILEKLSVQERARIIGEKAIEIINGRTDSFADLLRCVSELQSEGIKDDGLEAVTTDVDKLLELCPAEGTWKFNLPDLQTAVSGLNPGSFVIVPARPETGKTAFWVSLVTGPGGYLSQGARVHAIVNEEPGERTMLRAINAATGIPTSVLHVERPDIVQSTVGTLFRDFKIIDAVGLTIEALDRYVSRHRPDVLIVDQLDKLGIEGSFARTDEKLRAIYTAAREIAKRHSLVFIAISQASAGAEGRLFITMDLLENSRTGKAAEADLIIAIGKRNTETGEDEPARTLYIPKNKISGWHGTINCVLQHKLSRYI